MKPDRTATPNAQDRDNPIETDAGGNGNTSRNRLEAVWSVLITLVILVFVWRQRTDLGQAIHEMRLANPWWLTVLLATALAMHGCMTQALSAIIGRIGHRIPFLPAFMTHAEREMIATVMPFGGVASFVALVTRFGVYGVTRNDAVLAVMLYSVIGHLSFLLVGIPTMLWLAANHNATGIVWIGAAVILVSATTVVLLVSALTRGKSFPGVIETRLPHAIRGFRADARAVSITASSLVTPMLFSLAADLFGVLAVWTALRALHVDAAFTTAAAAYVVGALLMLAAPVFQGLGVVEVSVTITLQRLGVPLPQALGATILYRLVEVWLPVIIGVGVHARSQPALRGFPALLPALWTGLTGLLAIASVMPQGFRRELHDIQRVQGLVMLHPSHAGRTITLVTGFLLLLLAIRLARRHRSAWIVALVLTSLITLIYLVRDIDAPNAIISGANIVLLLLYRRRFRVRSDIPSLRRGVIVLLLSVSVAYAYGVLSLWLADRRHFEQEFSIVSSLRTARDIYLGFGNAGLQPRTGRAAWILESMHVLAALSLLTSAVTILQPIVSRGRVKRSDTRRARDLIMTYGRSSLDRFKFWPDKHQFFASDDIGVVSYGVSARVAMVLGDPSARDDVAFSRTLDEFLDFCDVNGWAPAFHQVPPVHLNAYRARGLTAVQVGQDAIVHLPSFTLSGHGMKNLRSLRNRAERDGRHVEIVDAPLPDELMRELTAISDDWLTLPGRRERTFTLGQFEPGYIRSSKVLVLRSVSGEAEAFINLIHDGAPGELTFDLMRHRVDAPNGAMDLLLLSLISMGNEHGYTWLSLGMVPFISPQATGDAALLERAIARLAKPMGRLFASESLFAYKDKFHPRWEPRYMVVRSVVQLPRAALALTRLSDTDAWHPAADSPAHNLRRMRPATRRDRAS